MRYFLLLDAGRFQSVIIPALAACWAKRTFAPAQILCREVKATLPPDSAEAGESVVSNVAAARVPFRRDVWRLLAGEILLFSAAELPEIETPLGSLTALLKLPLAQERAGYSPIQQCIDGSRDLAFGGAYYRPDCAGWNDLADVRRLAAWLANLRPEEWTAVDLPGSDAEDELAFAREWFPELLAMYRRAAERGYAVVCEQI